MRSHIIIGPTSIYIYVYNSHSTCTSLISCLSNTIFNFASRSHYLGTRTTKSSAYDTEHERRQSHNISKKLERNRSRSRSRSRSSPSSSASSSSSPSPDRHYGSTHQSECRSKNEHKLSKHDSNYLAADKNVNDCESRNDSCSTSTGSSSNIKQNGNNRIALGQSNRYRHDSDGNDESIGWLCLSQIHIVDTLCVWNSFSVCFNNVYRILLKYVWILCIGTKSNHVFSGLIFL